VNIHTSGDLFYCVTISFLTGRSVMGEKEGESKLETSESIFIHSSFL